MTDEREPLTDSDLTTLMECDHNPSGCQDCCDHGDEIRRLVSEVRRLRADVSKQPKPCECGCGLLIGPT
jgi:hypothetical protein